MMFEFLTFLGYSYAVWAFGYWCGAVIKRG
jgi:hypothetical protein